MTLMTLMSKLNFSNWAWSELNTATAGQQLLLAGAAALPHVVQLFRSMDRQHMEGVSRLSRNAGYMWKRGENQKHRVAGTYPKSKMYESASLLISTLHNLPAPAKKTSCSAGDWSHQSGPPIGMPHAEQEFRVWSFTICLRFAGQSAEASQSGRLRSQVVSMGHLVMGVKEPWWAKTFVCVMLHRKIVNTVAARIT